MIALKHCQEQLSNPEQSAIQKSIEDSSQFCVSMPRDTVDWFTVKDFAQIITDMA